MCHGNGCELIGSRATAHPEQTEKTVFEMFEAERGALIGYRGPFDSFRATVASVSKTCLVSFDGNKYSAMDQGRWSSGRHPRLHGRRVPSKGHGLDGQGAAGPKTGGRPSAKDSS
jgi:hypothetical protein